MYMRSFVGPLAFFAFAGCQEQAEHGTGLDRSVLEAQDELVSRIYEEADIVAHYEHREGTPFQLFLMKPDRTHGTGKRTPLKQLELKGIVAEIRGKDLAVVQVGKRPDQWPRDELDEIDAMFRGYGFRRVVICQAVGIGPTLILRGAKNVWD